MPIAEESNQIHQGHHKELHQQSAALRWSIIITIIIVVTITIITIIITIIIVVNWRTPYSPRRRRAVSARRDHAHCCSSACPAAAASRPDLVCSLLDYG
jgi:uncharacterized membrane-anchored protein